MADHAVITIGVMDAGVLEHAVNMIGKGGNVVVTAVGGEGHTISLNGSPLTGWHKNIQGSLFGGANPLYDMPRLLGLWRAKDATEMHAILSSLPIWPYMDVTVQAMAVHPVDPSPPPA